MRNLHIIMFLFFLLLLLSGPVFVQHCSFPTSWVLCLFVLQFVSLSSFSVTIVLQPIVNMFINSISGIPNNAHPFPGATKKLHILLFFLCSNFTLYMPNCDNVVQLYVFSLIFLSFVAANWSMVVLENNFCKCKRALYFHQCPCQPYRAL